MVKAIMIIEMMGRPPEHITNKLSEHIDLINKIKGAKIIKKELNEPKKIDEKNDLYTSFAEVEFECQDFKQLTEITFDFMPASIEILEPNQLTFSLDEATAIVNNISGRLHRYDDVVKIMKNREQKFTQDINIAKKILKSYDLIGNDGRIKKEVVEKINKEKEKKINKLK